MTKLFRSGAGILFGLSLILFVVTLAYQLVMLRDLYQSAAMGMDHSLPPPAWVSVLEAISVSLSGAAIPFFGACVIDRADRILGLKSGGPGQ